MSDAKYTGVRVYWNAREHILIQAMNKKVEFRATCKKNALISL